MSVPTAPAGLREGIKETLEVAAAIAATLSAVKKAQADGVITFREKLGFVRLGPELFAAIVGIGNVAEELKDLNPGELNDIIGQFTDRGVIPDDALKRDRADIVVDITMAIVRGLNEWNNIGDKAPKAVPLDPAEMEGGDPP